MINNFATVTPNSSPGNGPGGNAIVPTPASPSDWPKMLLAIGALAGFVWITSAFGGEDASKWIAAILLLAIITWYETHGNNQFSNGLKALTGSI